MPEVAREVDGKIISLREEWTELPPGATRTFSSADVWIWATIYDPFRRTQSGFAGGSGSFAVVEATLIPPS